MFRWIIDLIGVLVVSAIFQYVIKRLPRSLVDNAMTSYIDNKIGAAFGLTETQVDGLLSEWGVPLLIGTIAILAWHAIASRQMAKSYPAPAAQEQLAAKNQELAKVGSSVTVTATKIPAPYYTKTDIDRILEALFQTSDLLAKKGIPLRSSADSFLSSWKSILLNNGEPEFQNQAKQLRLKVEAIDQGTWDIINNNQHYVKELAPVFLDRAPVQRFLERLAVLVQAGERLPPNFDQRTLTLLEPMRNDVGQAFAELSQWMSNVFDKSSKETQRFRAMSQRAEK